MRCTLLLLLAACAAGPDPFADAVVRFEAGAGAGFGADALPEVVLGPPRGAGEDAGGLDVLSLGDGGVIELALEEPLVDGPGVDLLVFENAFVGFTERGAVAVSADAEAWSEWPCAADGAGCAGMSPVLSHPDNGIDPTDPALAGGDGFDLAALGLSEAWFVRVRDAGGNPDLGPTAGFDLDAIAAVHAAP